MAQVNSLTINDGANTPVALSFTVADRDGTSSTFRTDDSALVQGQKSILHRADLAGNSKAANRSRMTVIYPVEGLVNGVTKVISTSTAVIDINYAQSLTADQRKAFYGLVVNMLSHADVKAQNVAVKPLS